MNIDKGKLYITIVAIDEIYNFVVEKFMNWNCLGSQNIIVSAQILKFQKFKIINRSRMLTWSTQKL